jgi:hypothetical protein
MVRPLSRYVHPFDVVRHPTLEPEVKQAILASWGFREAGPAQGRPRRPRRRRVDDR